MSQSNMQLKLTAAALALGHAYPAPKVVPITHRYPAANSTVSTPPVKPQGRPKKAKTGRKKLVKEILKVAAQEAGVPLHTMYRFDHAYWTHFVANLSSAVIDRIMARLAASLPHRIYGTAKAVPDVLRGYAAGLVDGEGCFCIFRPRHKKRKLKKAKKNVLRPVFQLGLTNQRVLVRLQDTMGAWSYLNGSKQNIKQNRQFYTYTVASAPHIIHMLAPIYDLLDVKKQQAEALIRFFLEGRQWKMGPGTPKVVLARRLYWYTRLKRMK